MSLLNVFPVLIIGFMLTSCAVEPVPINYGQDACDFCKMNIVDRQYAAEIVTQKGKAYKYDAIECMMQSLGNWSEDDIAFYLMTDYNNPGVLIDATKAAYLIAEELPSPMGANLTGFKNEAEAQQLQQQKKGTILSWKALKEKYKNQE